MSPKDCIGFIGGGNMASAICKGIIDKGVYKAANVWVSGPHPENLKHLESLGIHIIKDNGLLLKMCDIIFISVKPHILNDAVEDCVKSLGEEIQLVQNKLFISILAGKKLSQLKEALSPFEPCRIIRTMPNTPMLLGEGASVYTPSYNATAADCRLVETILGCLGIYEKVPESMINAIGGLSGSGPAFVYLMIEAMADGGVKQGIPRPMATKFAAQTVMGAAKMVLDTGKHPGQLKDEVCSAGGSTICGIHSLEKGGVRAAYIDAIQAAVEKSVQMSSN